MPSQARYYSVAQKVKQVVITPYLQKQPCFNIWCFTPPFSEKIDKQNDEALMSLIANALCSCIVAKQLLQHPAVYLITPPSSSLLPPSPVTQLLSWQPPYSTFLYFFSPSPLPPPNYCKWVSLKAGWQAAFGTGLTKKPSIKEAFVSMLWNEANQIILLSVSEENSPLVCKPSQVL